MSRFAAADASYRVSRPSHLAPRVTTRVAGWLAVALLAALPFGTARAQRVLGTTEDATVVPRGAIRVTAGISFSRADERFASGHPGGAARGQREPLGASLSFDTLGVNQIERLAPLTQPLRTLSGQSALELSLGALGVALNRDVRTLPIAIDAGLTSRLTLGVFIPYHFVRNDVAVLPGGGGNLGLNPAASIPDAQTRNGAVLSQLFAASARLRARLASCETDPSGAGCADLNANRQQALVFLTQADAGAAGLLAVYGDATRIGSPFAPIAGSSLEQAIFARLSAFNASFQTFLSLPVDSVLIAARPVGATRLTLMDVNAILSDSASGILAAPLESVEHGHLGDVEVSAKFLLYDGFQGRTSRRLARVDGVKARLSVGAAYRFATGMPASPNGFADLGTGDGTPDIEARGYLDVVVGNRFWWSTVVRFGFPQPDTVTVRIPDANAFGLPAAYRRHNVERARGKYLEAEWSPRLVLNDFFAVAGYYRYRRSDTDNYAGTFNVTDLSGNTQTLDASSLGAFTDTQEHRTGFALSYSTIAGYAARRSGVPLELTLLIARVVRGAGVPAEAQAAFSVRWFHKVLGPNELRR
ncbi:MAG: hypothetical protein ACT4P6_04745 [Gemmatimonadaceae bacterium]